MFDKILYRVVAPIVLAVFTFTSCASPFVGGGGGDTATSTIL